MIIDMAAIAYIMILFVLNLELIKLAVSHIRVRLELKEQRLQQEQEIKIALIKKYEELDQ